MKTSEIIPVESVVVVELSAAEIFQLTECEKVIQRGLTSFMVVGKALLDIRENRLYRATHSSFDSYLVERWKMGRKYADRVIASTGVAEKLTPIGVTFQNESQIRPLIGQPPEVQAEVARELSTDPEPLTGKKVQAALEKVTGLKPKEANQCQKTPPQQGTDTFEAVLIPGRSNDISALKAAWHSATKSQQDKFILWLRAIGFIDRSHPLEKEKAASAITLTA